MERSDTSTAGNRSIIPLLLVLLLGAACGSATPASSPAGSAPTASRSTPMVGTVTQSPSIMPTVPPAPTTPSSASGGIAGQLLAGPACPVARADQPCPDRPLQTTLNVVDASGRVVTTITSDADGRFRIALAPGSYTLVPASKAPLPRAAPQQVTVQAGTFTAVEIHFDTGLR